MARFLTLIFFLFIFFFSVTLSSSVQAAFVCDDNVPLSDCTPISNVSCNDRENPNPPLCDRVVGGRYNNVAYCDAFDYTDPLGKNYFKRYYYRIKHEASPYLKCGSAGWAYSHTWYQTGPLNTVVLPNSCHDYATPGAPAGCNQGIQPGGAPTATPTPGGPTPTGACPTQYKVPPNICHNAPCVYKNACGCACENPPCAPYECSGGPPPTATPTPSPTPFCRLFCPGQEGLIGGLGAGGLGVPNNDFPPTPVLPTYAVGFINYFGYNSFQCGTFDDAKNPVQACPQSRGGGPLGGGSTDSWTYPTPTTNPIRYNMLCGGQPQTYTSIVTAGDRSSGGSGGGAGGQIGSGQPTLTPTAGPTPTIALYPPGCVLGPPTPTPEGGIPRVGDQDADFFRSQGGGIQSSPDSCACSVRLACQSALESPPSQTGQGCTGTCDFTVNPDNPVYNESTAFTLTTSGTTNLNFDDNTAPLVNPASPVNHTFVNAGVYKVALSCNSTAEVCKRDVNVYCSFIPKLWYKLKDTSLHKRGTLRNPIPDPVVAYDADDTTDRQLIISQGGLVSSDAEVNVGTATASLRDWRKTNYTPSTRWTPAAFLEYVKSRKPYVTVSASGTITGSDLTKNAINVATGNFTLDSSSVQSKSPFVLIIVGNATITGNINPPAKSLVVMATGTLNITSAVSELNGIFIGNNIDFASDIASGSTTATTLKVNGNIVSLAAADMTKRQGTDIKKPSLFVVFKPDMYIDLLSLLSVRQYNFQELNP